MTEKQFDEINHRRHALIMKEAGEGLTEIETQRLDKMQKIVSTYTHEKYPLPWRELYVMKAELKKKRRQVL